MNAIRKLTDAAFNYINRTPQSADFLTFASIMKSFFETLFRYNLHCNQQLAEIFERETTRVDAKSVALFSHILNAHHIWNSRILGRKTKYGVWDDHAVDAFAALDRLNHEDTLHILATCNLATEIAYRTTKGIPFANTVNDTLFHVVNHSTYHRGQIAPLFRQNGIEPLPTDYIRYRVTSSTAP